MSEPILNLEEQALVRAWIRGVPLSSLALGCENSNAPALLADARNKLYLKSNRLQVAWGKIWLDKKLATASEKCTLEKLAWLIQQPDIRQSVDHPLSYWLNPELVCKLSPLKLNTCTEFIHYYASSPTCWWADTQGLGDVHGKIIEREMERLFPGALIKSWVSVTRQPVFETNIVPLERFLMPEAYDGSSGTNRGKTEPSIPAANDLQAIDCWLSRIDKESHTYRSYKREAERLLLWAILERGKPLSSIDSVDMADYRHFLKAPTPAEKWMGPPKKRQDKDWKPFTGPLSEKSARLTNTILNGLFAYLVELDYLNHNPIKPLPKMKSPQGDGRMDINRSFTDEQWKWIDHFAKNLIADSEESQDRIKWIRARMIIQLGYSTGLRLHEIVQAKMGDIYRIERGQEIQYWINVLGKGNKLRDVPIPDSAYTLLVESYHAITGRPMHRASSDYPIIPSLRKSPKEFLTPLAIHKTIKAFFARASRSILEENPELSIKINQASAHWLRHTYGSTAVDRAIPLAMVRESMGHSSLSTTTQYVHADDDARHQAFNEKF